MDGKTCRLTMVSELVTQWAEVSPTEFHDKHQFGDIDF